MPIKDYQHFTDALLYSVAGAMGLPPHLLTGKSDYATVKIPVRLASGDDNWLFHETGHCQNRLAFCPECARTDMQKAGVEVSRP